MAEYIFIGVAWPYANGALHLGQVPGAYLPADIFARYHRLKGNKVLMVSGSDQHGTPITLRAEQENKSPQDIVSGYHREFLACWQKFGISFDLFTTTGTVNHTQVVHDVFLALLLSLLLYCKAVVDLLSGQDAHFGKDSSEGPAPQLLGGRQLSHSENPFCGYQTQ